jgi:hypothetical protein
VCVSGEEKVPEEEAAASVNAFAQRIGELSNDHGGALFAGGTDAEKF